MKEEGFSILVKGNEELEALYEKINIGQKGISEFIIKLAPHRKDVDKIIKSYKFHYANGRVVNDRALELVANLRKKYKVYCYTDCIKENYEVNLEKGIYKDFDDVFKSYEFGMKKKHPNAFPTLLKRIKLKGEECFFIDDHPVNIENAKKSGLHVIHYTQFPDVEPILKGLRELGVEIG